MSTTPTCCQEQAAGGLGSEALIPSHRHNIPSHCHAIPSLASAESPASHPSPNVYRVNPVDLLDLPGLAESLAIMEDRLDEAVRVGDPFLDQVTTHLIAAGGKRLRPALALAAASAGAGPAGNLDPSSTRGADQIQGAVAVELVHLASLYHDDVMDEAVVRRNVASVNARWGNLVAIVAGDFLLARSAELAAALGAEIAGLLAATLGALCQGQIQEVQTAFQASRTKKQYRAAIEGKTAALMGTSCRIGALTGGVSSTDIDALTSYGREFGMAFQVRDDILDVTSGESELGKPAGQDLAEGIYTLPVLYALADPEVAPELSALLGQPLAEPERDKARAAIQASSGIREAVRECRQYARRASSIASRLEARPLGEALDRLAIWLTESLPEV